MLLKARKKPFVSTTDRCCFGLSDWQASGRKDEFINEYVKQNDQLLKIEKRGNAGIIFGTVSFN